METLAIPLETNKAGRAVSPSLRCDETRVVRLAWACMMHDAWVRWVLGTVAGYRVRAGGAVAVAVCGGVSGIGTSRDQLPATK